MCLPPKCGLSRVCGGCVMAIAFVSLLPAGCRLPRWASEESPENARRRQQEEDNRAIWSEATNGAWDGEPPADR